MGLHDQGIDKTPIGFIGQCRGGGGGFNGFLDSGKTDPDPHFFFCL
ncbi:hypothetical protein [Rhodospirillum rubrum]|nr:hypothetical protein [Rhodospirillum rubrum]